MNAGTKFGIEGTPVIPPAIMTDLQQVRSALALVCELLVTAPSAANLASCQAGLEFIAVRLRAIYGAMDVLTAAGRAALAPALTEAAQDLAAVNQLFAQGMLLYGNWVRIFRAKVGGYTRTGEPAALLCVEQFVWKG